jgi:hypothetical protein
MFQFRLILIILLLSVAIGGFSEDNVNLREDSRYFKFSARRRFMDKYRLPLESFWQDLEVSRPEGRYIKEYRIKEMREEVKDLPDWIAFEKAFSYELKKDERIIQARDAAFNMDGPLKIYELKSLEEKRRIEKKSPGGLYKNPRTQLQKSLAHGILRFWKEKEITELDETVRHYDLKEKLYEMGQVETPDMFQIRRKKGRQRFMRYQPLKHFRMRMFRELMDSRAEDLIRRWRERSPAFSRNRE